jgi:hypothetical protein
MSIDHRGRAAVRCMPRASSDSKVISKVLVKLVVKTWRYHENLNVKLQQAMKNVL